MCQILLARDRSVSVWMKAGTGIAVLIVMLLSVQWVRVTSGWPAQIRLRSHGTTHTVKLKWRASSSQVAGYNVYRSTTPAGNYVLINSSPVPGTTFTDNTVEGGLTYYYVTRAVDALGRESVNSNEASAVIP
jgi:fibronectin type 3 domain-containing protein